MLLFAVLVPLVAADDGELRTSFGPSPNSNPNSSSGGGNGTLHVGGDEDITYNGIIIATRVEKVGTGTLTLGGTFGNLIGSFVVNDGTVVGEKLFGSATGIGAVTIGNDRGAAGSAVFRNGAADQIMDSSAVTIGSDGRFDLAGHNERIGSLSSDAASASISLGGGTLSVGDGHSTTYAGTISGNGTLAKVGAGTLTLAGTSTFTGSTIVHAGTLQLAADNALGSGGSLTISSGATVRLEAGVSQSVAGLATGPTSTIDLGANAVLTVNTTQASTLLGSLTGTGTLAYTGSGDLTLGSNLMFGGTLAFGGSSVGGTPTQVLHLADYVNLGTLHITGDTILDFGNSSATTLSVMNLIVDAGVNVSVINWINSTDLFTAQNFPGAIPDQGGNSPYPGNASSQISFDGSSSDQTVWQSWDRQITPTPEPKTYGVILLSCLVGCLGIHRLRHRTRAV